ncbi:diguanylate cyclase [Aurantimonas sp. Leaf443]|uniref:GGDEF domain-containing protein n=1 Tax=Aurantimonas sp. Leaf443 TaxID=1736378 RepID=UPI0006F6C7CE|nr:diguanylate cyclase [Aurantimonas sp. Leaf443]KQT85381.1 hypothetical protein ASG48_09095 [Aurantimonas sp. Leaf443]
MRLLTCLSIAVALPFLLAVAFALLSYAQSERAGLEREGVLANAQLTARIEDAVRQQFARLRWLSLSPLLDGSGDVSRFREKLGTLDYGLDISLVETATGRLVAALDDSLAQALPAERRAALVAPGITARWTPALDLMEPLPGRFVVPLVAPVHRAGEARYSLLALLPAARLGQIMGEAHVLPPFSASLVDRQGRIIARTNPVEQRTGQLHPLAGQRPRDSGMRSGLNPQGIEALSFYKRSPFTGWIVSSSVAVDALVAPLHRSLWLIGSLVLALLVLSAVFGYAITSRLTRTTRGLIAAAQALGRRLPVDARELPLREGNEILRALSAASLALDEQDCALRRANETLEARVEERTRALNEALRKAEAAEAMAVRAGNELARLATTDALTTLANRRSFDETIAGHFACAEGERAALSLLVLDADHFKRVNDEHGHDVGDAVLQALAERLAADLRLSNDRIFRIGGEEFAVLLPGTSQAAALAVCARLHAAAATVSVPATPIVPGSITISIGMATLEPGHRSVPADLYRAADRALYRAKRSGRNCTQTGSLLDECLPMAS